MHHSNQIIETDDIQDVLDLHISNENGQNIVTIKAVLDPRKDYLHEKTKEMYLHLTNGVQQRTFGGFNHRTPLE